MLIILHKRSAVCCIASK